MAPSSLQAFVVTVAATIVAGVILKLIGPYIAEAPSKKLQSMAPSSVRVFAVAVTAIVAGVILALLGLNIAEAPGKKLPPEPASTTRAPGPSPPPASQMPTIPVHESPTAPADLLPHNSPEGPAATPKPISTTGFGLLPMIRIKMADFVDGERIPDKYTCVGSPNSPSPAVSWTGAPAETESLVLILHTPDPVLGGSATFDLLFWAIFDIPGDSEGLPEGLPNGDQPNGARQLKNVAGSNGYLRICAAAGWGESHFFFEVYALNAKLGLPASVSRSDLLNAMNGKVIAKGVFIGRWGQ